MLDSQVDSPLIRVSRRRYCAARRCAASVLVMRTEAIPRGEESLDDECPEGRKPLEKQEASSLLRSMHCRRRSTRFPNLWPGTQPLQPPHRTAELYRAEPDTRVSQGVWIMPRMQRAPEGYVGQVSRGSPRSTTAPGCHSELSAVSLESK